MVFVTQNVPLQLNDKTVHFLRESLEQGIITLGCLQTSYFLLIFPYSLFLLLAPFKKAFQLALLVLTCNPNIRYHCHQLIIFVPELSTILDKLLRNFRNILHKRF